MTDAPSVPPSRARWGPWLAGIWLFFLADPVLAGWRVRDTAAGMVGLAATVLFGVVYMAMWLRLRRDRITLVMRPTIGQAVGLFSVLVALGVVMTLTLGETGTASAVYCAVTAVMVFPYRYAVPLVLSTAILVVVLGATVPGWDSMVGLAFSICAAALAVFGIRAMLARNVELLRAQEQNANLAVENERNRLARDLHDILGHSLTVITVKAQLARRLIDSDPDQVRAELVDLERLSRDALVDVRRAVEGYREISLPGELARARAALAASQITARLPNSTDDIPSDLRDVFAWTVREGVTNVIRHSGARTCEIVLTDSSAEVRDDGRGPLDHDALGAGLVGLRQRAATAGATVITSDLAPGFSLRVQRA